MIQNVTASNNGKGSEAEAILMVAEKQQADLIVIGTRGFGAVKGLLVGSMSRKVIHLSTCPVMVVH
jgi:nucleotide-binding universal stress UspA family protein